MDTNGPAAVAPALGELSHGQAAPRASAVLLRRGLRLAMRRPADALAAAAFFLLVSGLCALATAPLDLPKASMAAVAVWIAALLSALLGQLHSLREDAQCGVLDQLRLAPGGPLGPVTAMLAAHVFTTCVPLLAAAPATALFYGLDAAQLGRLVASLVLGLPAVCVLAAFAVSLTLGGRGGPAWLGLMVLPLSVPVLLFGTQAAADGGGGAWWLLAAFSVLSAAVGPFLVAAALRLEDQG
jgi:heme exporter protein B